MAGAARATEREIRPTWYTTREVAEMLRYSLTKTKYLIKEGKIRSIKDGGSRRILPEHVAEYIRLKAQESEAYEQAS
jgi:excisionase family DNA binding protein